MILIHLEFVFIYGVRECSTCILLHAVVQFSQHHLLKRQYYLQHIFSPLSVQFSSVTQLCLTPCNPMNYCSMPGLTVHHQLPEFTQTHLHWVSDAIQPSHPLLSPSLPCLQRLLSQRLIDHRCVHLFLGFPSCSTDLFFLTAPHCFDDCSFVV